MKEEISPIHPADIEGYKGVLWTTLCQWIQQRILNGQVPWKI